MGLGLGPEIHKEFFFEELYIQNRKINKNLIYEAHQNMAFMSKKAENPPFMKAQISFLKNCRGRVQFPQMECKKIEYFISLFVFEK